MKWCFTRYTVGKFWFFLCLRVNFHTSLFWVPILAAGGPYWVPISKLGGPYKFIWQWDRTTTDPTTGSGSGFNYSAYGIWIHHSGGYGQWIWIQLQRIWIQQKLDQNPTTMDQDAMHGYDSQMMMVMHTVPKRVPTIGLWVWWFCLLLTNKRSTVWGPTCYGVLGLI